MKVDKNKLRDGYCYWIQLNESDNYIIACYTEYVYSNDVDFQGFGDVSYRPSEIKNIDYVPITRGLV